MVWFKVELEKNQDKVVLAHEGAPNTSKTATARPGGGRRVLPISYLEKALGEKGQK